MEIRVFHFILDPRVGGPHIYVRNLSQALASDVDSSLVTAGQGPQTDIALFNLRHLLRWLYPLEVVMNALWLCKRFWRSHSRQGTIFNVHGAGNLAPILAARILGVPMVWHFHETGDGFSMLVALGKRMAAEIPHHKVVVAKKAAVVFKLPDATLIPGAVDSHFWSVAKSNSPPCEAPLLLRILSVGNINPLKGCDVLLTALEAFRQPYELVIVGAELQTYSRYARELRKHAERLESSLRRICFAGWQSPEAVRSLMADSDVFVLASRSEACPLALLEAMAAGCVCIATDVGDVREILEAAGSGIVVPSDSSPALTAALEKVTKMNYAERQRIGKLAQEAIVAEYSLQTQAASHLRIYKKLASISKGVT